MKKNQQKGVQEVLVQLDLNNILKTVKYDDRPKKFRPIIFLFGKKYYICNVKFKSYKDMANKTSVISNTNAYGFARNVVAPTIVESLKSVSGISKVAYNKPTNIKDEIKLSFTEDSKKTYAVLAYTGEGDIKLSQYHMYNAKGNGIAFIKDGYAYFVELATLQANWSNIMNGFLIHILMESKCQRQ